MPIGTSVAPAPVSMRARVYASPATTRSRQSFSELATEPTALVAPAIIAAAVAPGLSRASLTIAWTLPGSRIAP
jgi:hypothetical protein